MTQDPRVDAYIAKQADFARPILEAIRAAVHAGCPEVEETIKWSMSSFVYKGKILAMAAVFKAHATLGFWRAGDVLGETGAERDAMGQFGRLTSLADLPPRAELEALVRKAMTAIEAGPKPRPKKPPRPELATPDDLATALAAEPQAAATFAGFAPSCRREYVEWVIEAKRPETRAKRVAQAVAWMAEGKRRNWKYEGC
ncbi:MAG TPA: YdeI/OmpD-associated family protein [Allosphingosinicella sp.]